MKLIVVFFLLCLAAPLHAATIEITWMPGSDNHINFHVLRSVSGAQGEYGLIQEIAKDERAYRDSGLREGIEYCYKLQACNDGGCSLPTPPICLTIPYTIPATPIDPQLRHILE